MTEAKHGLSEKNRKWLAVGVAVAFLLAAFRFFPEFRIYADAVRDHWIILMSGVVSVAITFYEKIRDSIGKYALYVVALSCVFFAGFQAWRDQYRAVQQAKPNLTAKMQRISLMPYGDTPDVFMVLLVKVKNSGAPSSLDEIAVEMTLNSGRKVTVIGVQAPKDGFLLKEKNGAGTWLPESRNLVLEGQNPIPTGGLIEGFLLGILRGVDVKEVMKLPLWVQLSFDDAIGSRVTAKFETSTTEAEVFDASTIMKPTAPHAAKP